MKLINKDDDKEYPQKTKFNAGLAKLERIDKLRQACHDSRILHKHQQWYDCLVSYYVELHERMDEEDKKKASEFITNIKKSAEEQKKDSYTELLKYELWLTERENKFGFSMPDKKESIDATDA